MSLTTWTRLEPDTQTNQPSLDLGEGIAARLADPLWLLGRQWQMGELSGEDAASPVVAHIAAASFAIDSLQTGPAPQPFSATSVSPEAEVEHDGSAASQRTREAGAVSLVERLRESGLHANADAVSKQYGMEGDAILGDMERGGLPDQQAWSAVAEAWAAWYRPRAQQRTNPAWAPDRLEYRFSMGATVAEGRVTLTAPEHRGDRLDWDAFSASTPEPGPPASPQITKADLVPALLQIPGMPALAFWEMEDPRVDPGRIDATATDPARLLLIETALSYAADWFLVPLRLPMASLSRIDSLLITDTFGVTTIIRPAEAVRPHGGWRLWRVSNLPYLLLPPPNTGFLESEPTDHLAFVRDEAANLAWALQLLPRTATLPAAPPFEGTGDLTYVPHSDPPDDRRPLLLNETAAGRTLILGHLTGRQTQPSSPLLPDGFELKDEELPDEGLILERRYELGRTPDGALHLWKSRVKRTGATLPASGLEFDKMQ